MKDHQWKNSLCKEVLYDIENKFLLIMLDGQIMYMWGIFNQVLSK